MKHILIINSGTRPGSRASVGGDRYTFMQINSIEDTRKVRGMVCDDIVWVVPVTDRKILDSVLPVLAGAR